MKDYFAFLLLLKSEIIISSIIISGDSFILWPRFIQLYLLQHNFEMIYDKLYKDLCELLWKEPVLNAYKLGEEIIADDVKAEFPLIADCQVTSLKQHLKIFFFIRVW